MAKRFTAADVVAVRLFVVVVVVEVHQVLIPVGQISLSWKTSKATQGKHSAKHKQVTHKPTAHAYAQPIYWFWMPPCMSCKQQQQQQQKKKGLWKVHFRNNNKSLVCHLTVFSLFPWNQLLRNALNDAFVFALLSFSSKTNSGFTGELELIWCP